MRMTQLPDPAATLPGRSEAMPLTNRHFVNGAPLKPPFPTGAQLAVFGLGCFWGAERRFWQQPGVLSTAVGYAGGLHGLRSVRGRLSGEEQERNASQGD